MRIPLSYLASLAALALLSGAARAGAQTSDDLFAEAGVQDLQLLVNSTDLALLRQDYTANTYYPADIEYRGVRVRNVGIRSRGLGSRSATKLGLRVDMNRFSSGQRFFGETAVVLDNLWQDATLVRERLAMAMFERAGIAAPREVFVRLFVNGSYEGLYALTEEVNKQFLERTGAAGDVLFEFKWVTEYRAEDLGADPAAYVPLFEARTHESDAVPVLYGPLLELLHDAAPLEGAAWRAYVESRLDLRQLLSYVAVESFLADPDGLLGYAGMNNFYLHRPEAGAVHRVIPWDKDNAFADPASSIWLRTGENALVTRALGFSDLREHYLQAVTSCAALAAEDGWLANRLEALLTLADAPAIQDLRKPHTEPERAAATAALREFVATRPAQVAGEVASPGAIVR